MENVSSLPLTSSQLVIITLVALFAFAFVLVFTVAKLSKNPEALAAALSRDSIVLRLLTVLIVVWAAFALAILGRLTEGMTGLFGTVVGYAFGSYVPRPKEEPPESASEGTQGTGS